MLTLLAAGGLATPAFASTAPPVDANGWVQVSTDVQLVYIDMNQSTYLNDNIELMNNIDLSNNSADWVPFGNTSSPYAGTFNGQAHEITGLTIVNGASDGYVGFFGGTSGIIENVGVTGSVSGGTSNGGLAGFLSFGGVIKDSYATGSVSGGTFDGGLVGYQSNASIISDSYTTGSVSGGTFNGGLVGGQGGGSISDSYATGSVSGSAYIGGLVGEMDGGSISASYATVSVPVGTFDGGLVGAQNGGSISASYFDSDTAPVGVGNVAGPLTSDVTGKSTSDMQYQSTYTGWDFSSTWGTSPNINSGYPYLQGMLSTSLTPSASIAVSGQPVTVTGVVYYGGGLVNHQSVTLTAADGVWSNGSVTDTDTDTVYSNSSGQYTDTWTAPTVTSETPITVSVYGGNVTQATFSIDVAPRLNISTTTLPSGTVGTSYAQTLHEYGGFAPYSWSVSSGSLPAGLSLDASTGVISGTPTQLGTGTFSVQVQDSAGYTATQSVSMASNNAGLSGLTPSAGSLSPAFAAGTTSYTESVANSVGSITLTPTTTDANATVKVNGQAVTSGHPSSAITLSEGGTTPVTVVVTAQDGSTTQTYTVTVTRAAATVTPPATPPSNSGSNPPPLPTVLVTQTVSAQATTIKQAVDNSGTTVQIDVPAGAFSTPETLSVTTETPSELTRTVTNLPTGSVPVVVLGVNFTGAAPTVPVTVTITSDSIPADALIYKLGSDGQLTPVQATVTAGKAVITFTSDPDFVVVKPQATTPPTQPVDLSTLKAYQRVITVGSDNWVVPSIVAHHTTYVPMWYVMEALRSSANVQSTWNGHEWDMLTKSKVDVSHLHPGHGKQSIQLNGQLVQWVTGVADPDPSTKRETMYMPIWYVMQVLNRVGLKSTWNGTTWTIAEQKH